jgi:uncharacterized protein (TIGR00725 family)
MRPIAVIGAHTVTNEQYRTAYQLGHALASRHYPIICGGRTGVMRAVAEGCCDARGICIGVLPNLTDPVTPGSIVIATDLGNADNPIANDVSRNRVLVRAALCVFAIHGGPGTANELRFAWEGNKRVFGLHNPPSPQGYERQDTWGLSGGRFSEHGSLKQALTAFEEWVQLDEPFATAALSPR